jgi:hypothetical protein
VHLAFAIPNHPWVNAGNDAAMRTAMMIARTGAGDAVLLTVADETQAPEVVTFAEPVVVRINSHQTIGATVTSAISLKSNACLTQQAI